MIDKASDLGMWLTAVWRMVQAARAPISLSQIYGEYEQMMDPAERTFTDGGVPDDEETDFPDQYFEFVPGSNTDKILDDPLAVGGLNTGGGYLYTKSPTFQEGASRRRVVLHLRPYNQLIKAMRLIVRDIVKAGGRFADVNGAKVMTPACFQSGRNDTLIIYVRTRQAADAVVRQLLHWVIEGDLRTKDFVAVLPKTIHPVHKGIGYACEPPQVTILNSYRVPNSYGRFLSQIIYIAMDIALAMTSDKGITRALEGDDYLRVAEAVFLAAGIDPAKPYEFGDLPATFMTSLPWMEGSSIQVRQTALYDRILGDMKRKFGWW